MVTFFALHRVIAPSFALSGLFLASQSCSAAIEVAASNSILADITREIAGDAAIVHCLTPTGVDPHGFEPTPADVVTLAHASLVVINGAGLEPWLDKLTTSSGFKGITVQASQGCDLIEVDHHPATSVDPHAWQAPANGIRYATNIRDGLIRADAPNAELFRLRARLYSAQLETLDDWARRLFASLSPSQRAIVTSHDSLAYFGRAYGIAITPVLGIDDRVEPDGRRVAALVDMLKANNARAIFVESVSNPKMLEQLARDTGATLGAELYTDSVGPADSPAATYLGMLRENVLRIYTALVPSI